MAFQWSYFKSRKMILWKCCTQYASTFGKLSSGHRTGKGQFSFQSQRKAMPKNVQTTTQLYSSHFTFTFHFHALEKEMATHSSVIAWRIPGTGEPGGLPSMGLHRVGHDWSDLAAAAAAHASKVMLKILQARPQQHVNKNFLMFTLIIQHHAKCWAGWLTSWNQDCWEKYQQPQICRWHASNVRKQRGTKAPLDEGERRVKKLI